MNMNTDYTRKNVIRMKSILIAMNAFIAIKKIDGV